MNEIVLKEIWRDVDGFEGLYQVSNLGRVKSLRGWNGHGYVQREKIMTAVSVDQNRKVLNLKKDGKMHMVKLHRLIAKAFIANPNGYDVINHVDSDPSNNDISNLEWCTQRQNLIHGHRFGNMKRLKDKQRGIKTGYRGKYGIDLRVLKHQMDNGASNIELAEIYQCPRTLIARRRYQYKKGEI